MKKILFFCLLHVHFMQGMEEPNYLSTLPDEMLLSVIYQLVAVEDSNIKHDLNGCYFSDGFQAPCKKDDILQIKNIKNFGMTCKRYNVIIKELLEDKNGTYLIDFVSILAQKFSKYYPFSCIDEKYFLNKDASNELYIALHYTSLVWVKNELEKGKKYFLDNKRSEDEIKLIMRDVIGQSLARALKPLEDKGVIYFYEELVENEVTDSIILNANKFPQYKRNFDDNLHGIKERNKIFEDEYDVYHIGLRLEKIIKLYPQKTKELLCSYLLNDGKGFFDYCFKYPKQFN